MGKMIMNDELILPITPYEVQRKHIVKLPEVVIQLIDALIVKYWDGRAALILESEIIELANRYIEDFHFDYQSVVFLYENSGWLVDYYRQDDVSPLFIEFIECIG